MRRRKRRRVTPGPLSSVIVWCLLRNLHKFLGLCDVLIQSLDALGNWGKGRKGKGKNDKDVLSVCKLKAAEK